MTTDLRIPVISVFAGCGGLDYGFCCAGFQPVVALEKNPTAVRTYNHNIDGDVCRMFDLAGDPAITMHEIRRAIGNLIPRGIIGGPPCQPFSNGNVTKRTDDRRSLPLRYAAIIKEANEEFDIDFFVFENVEGLRNRNNMPDHEVFLAACRRAGFVTHEFQLNALNFGVPQSRPRVFVVGLNVRRFADIVLKISNAPARQTVRDAIGKLPPPIHFERGLTGDDIPYHTNHWCMKPKSPKFKDASLLATTTVGRSFRVLRWDRPSWTVAYGNREVHIHPSGSRRLSVLEAMLLQGFPPEYELLGNLSEQFRQVCDAVPPPVASAIAFALKDILYDERATKCARRSGRGDSSTTARLA